MFVSGEGHKSGCLPSVVNPNAALLGAGTVGGGHCWARAPLGEGTAWRGHLRSLALPPGRTSLGPLSAHLHDMAGRRFIQERFDSMNGLKVKVKYWAHIFVQNNLHWLGIDPESTTCTGTMSFTLPNWAWIIRGRGLLMNYWHRPIVISSGCGMNVI